MPSLTTNRTESRPLAFTLVELMIVIAIVAVLLGLLTPALRAVRSSAEKTRELSAARQLMLGYVAYARDHRGAVLPGYYYQGPGGTPPAFDEGGTPITDLADEPAAARYPWRLAPYLDYVLDGLYLDEQILDGMRDEDRYHYLVSLYPSLGINCVFVGGTTDDPAAFSSIYQDTFGRFFVTRLSQSKHPADLIVFASARSQPLQSFDGHELIEGFHRVNPPYLVEREWEADRYEPQGAPGLFGQVSLRHGRSCVIGFFDGHTGSLDEGRITNMKYWADQATGPDWRLTAQ